MTTPAPLRLRAVLQLAEIPARPRVAVERGRTEEGEVSLLCSCDCCALVELTVWGVLDDVPQEVSYTCADGTTIHWVEVF